jgi:protein gp37
VADGTGIEWADATWNVVIGCDKVSPGCDHCYAIRTATRMQANPNPKVHLPYLGTAADGEWTGRVNMVEERLGQPHQWTRPRKIFVNAQSDLFHADVNDEFIAKVWAVMAVTFRHTYQILTKRPGRMRSLLNSDAFAVKFDEALTAMGYAGWADNVLEWPLPNVWLGVSVEDQKRADLRIPQLLATPAAVRWLSCEPLLGPVDLGYGETCDHTRQSCEDIGCWAALDWIVVGGESGPGARPMHPEWARSLRDQCAAASVPFLFKQWGEWKPWTGMQSDTHLVALDGRCITRKDGTQRDPISGRDHDLVDRGHPGWVRARKVGKKAAGRELDGVTHDGYPQEVAP